LAVRGFFENGGQRCFISRIAATDPLESGLEALDAQSNLGGLLPGRCSGSRCGRGDVDILRGG
jgi:hypothetical protein